MINKNLIVRYVGVSLMGYLFTFFGLYLMVDIFSVNKAISFAIIYGAAYVFLYLVHLKYLFLKKHSSKRLFRYALSIIFFYLAANLIYNIGLLAGLPYLLVMLITIMVLMPVRFFTLQKFVYKKS